MDSELKRFEAELERLSPGSLPEGLIARMEAAMEGWETVTPEVSEEADKVVPFPKLEENAEESEGTRSNRGLWAAAASVALLGAAAGILLSSQPRGEEGSDRVGGFVPAESVANVEFAPQGAKRMILDTSNEDMIIANGAKPLRVIRLAYVDRYVFRGENGETIEFEVPAVNYSVVPVPTD